MFKQNNQTILQTEGANFFEVNKFANWVDINKTTCTDVHLITDIYGVC